MSNITRQPDLSNEEIGRRWEELYARDLRTQIETEENIGKILALDINTGAYEIDANSLSAADRLRSRVPDAVVYALRLGMMPSMRWGDIDKDEAVIIGYVSVRHSLVPLVLRGANGQGDVDFILDTGFVGYLAMSQEDMTIPRLLYSHSTPAHLADGSRVGLAVYNGAMQNIL